MKRLLIISLMTGVLVSLVATGCGGSSKTATKQTTIPITTSSQSSNTTDSDTGQTGPIKEASVGESVKLGNFDFKVVGWKFDTWDNVELPDVSGSKPLVAEIEITNNGTKTEEINTSDMAIRTPDGYEFSDCWTLPNPGLPDSVEPSEKARGFLTFQVSNNVGTMALQFSRSPDGKARIKLQ